MAGNTVAMVFGHMFDAFVAADTGGLLYSPLTARDEQWDTEQKQKYDVDFAVTGCTDPHFRRRPLVI